MTAYTPGPWELQNSNDDYTRYQIEAYQWGIIATVDDISNESEANARLIAAAPDLLEALHIIDSYTHPLTGAHAVEMKRIARAAIAKATADD